MKVNEFKELLIEMGRCSKCTNEKRNDKSLINIYSNFNFCISIPSIWTDWFNRLDSKIMIIGQDWGPYNDMLKFNRMLNSNKSNWKEIIEKEKSRTKKQLTEYIKLSNNNYTLDDIFITNAIMCARNGDSYRGDNINLKRASINCSIYLKKQIDIVKPRVILTLGYYPLLSLSKIFNFEIKNTLKETIALLPEIKIKNYVIIPLYHPVAQIKKDVQLKQYDRIWKYLKD